MSYQYVRAVGVMLDGNSGEQAVDLSTLKTNQYASTFSKLAIVYADSLYNKQYVLRLTDHTYDFANYSGTIQEWLDSLGNRVLVGDTNYPGTKIVYVKAGDVQYYNYRLYPGDHQRSVDAQSTLTAAGAPDIRLQHARDTKDWKGMVKRSLFTVNGHFIRAHGLDDAIYLLGGGKNYRTNRNLHVNCLDFTGVTTLNTYPFKESMLQFIREDGYNAMHVNIDQDLENKQVWFVIGGRLFFGNPLLKRLSDRSFRVDWRHNDYIYRLFESLGYIDLNDVIDHRRQVISYQESISDALFKKLMLNLNSFFIVFDTPNIGVTITPLESFRYPTTFCVHDTFAHPLMLDNGLFPSYKARVQGALMLMDADLRKVPNPVNVTTGIDNGGNLYHNYISQYSPNHLVKGFSFKIHTLK